TADRVGSDFVTRTEWNYIARIAMYELYDILIGAYERYNTAPQVFINTSISPQAGSEQIAQYALPDGATNYLGGVLGGASGTPAPRFYKITGVDLGVNTSNNAWVTVHRFNWVDRNNYVYPNSTSTIYGVYNMRYNILNNNLVIIPNPAGNQQLRITYSPVLPALLQDSDLTSIGYSGWLRYPIVRMAKYALDKEEGTDTSKLDAELLFLKQRIEDMAPNRDEGMAETISNTRRDSIYGGSGWMDGGSNAGWAVLFVPGFFSNNIGNHLLTHSIAHGYLLLAFITFGIVATYFIHLLFGQLGRSIGFSWAGHGGTSSASKSSLSNFVSHVFKRGAQK